MTKAVYPGSFDPITKGHADVITRGSRIFDQVIVAIARNPHKRALFTMDERMDMIRHETRRLKNVKVDTFEGMLIDYVKKQGTNVILRGIRTVSDFEYEFQMALTNRTLDRAMETVFIVTSEEYSFMNSTLIKEVAALGGDTRAFVSAQVGRRLREKLAAQY
jgi:pantetheine-phosphate adenylyltransferase